MNPHFLGTPCVSLPVHLDYFLSSTPRRPFVSNLEGLAFQSEWFTSRPSLLQEQTQATLLISPLEFRSPANQSPFICPRTDNLLKTPLLSPTEQGAQHLRRPPHTLSDTSFTAAHFFNTICDRSPSTSSSVHAKLLPNSQMHPACCPCHPIFWNSSSPSFCPGISSFFKAKAHTTSFL